MKWIKVEDKCPPDDLYYLGCLRHESFPRIVRWDGEYFTIRGDEYGALDPMMVTHWMELPSLPTVE